MGHAAKTAPAMAKATAKPDSALAETHRTGFAQRMKCLAAFLALCLTLDPLAAETPRLTLDSTLVPSPATVGAHSPSLVPTDNGRVLLSWIAPYADNTPTLHVATFDSAEKTWSEPSVIGPTGPRPPDAKATTGPITAARNGRIATIWFVADEKDPRVLLSVSTDAGQHFLIPQRIEDTRPTGSPDLVLLDNGTIFVSWLEHYNRDESALWLRRISPGGHLSVPVLLATAPATAHLAAPRLARVKDYDTAPAQLLLAYALGEPGASQIVTRLLTLPRPATNGTRSPCNCPDD